MASTKITDYLAQGLAAARPVTPANYAGTVSYYFATDTQVMSVYANGAWRNAASGVDLYSPPLAASFPTLIGTTPVVTDTSYGMLFDSGATVGSDAIRAALQPIPNASTFTIIAGIRINMVALNYRSLGIALYDGTKFVTLYQISNQLQVNNFTNATSFSSAPISLSLGDHDQYYFKIQATGGNLLFSISKDGRNFIQILSTAIGAFLGAITKCGIVSNANANATPPAAGDHIFGDVFYWSATNP